MICRKNVSIGLRVNRSTEIIEDCTEEECGQGNAPESDQAVEKVLLKVIVFFPIDRPRNDETGKNKKNDNIILPVLRPKSAVVSAKEPVKISMSEEDRDGGGKS